jgi:hypothetical protein
MFRNSAILQHVRDLDIRQTWSTIQRGMNQNTVVSTYAIDLGSVARKLDSAICQMAIFPRSQSNLLSELI